jgi:hypothetical protein
MLENKLSLAGVAGLAGVAEFYFFPRIFIIFIYEPMLNFKIVA